MGNPATSPPVNLELKECRQRVYKRDGDGVERLYHLHESLWLKTCAFCGAKGSELKATLIGTGDVKMSVRSCFKCKEKYSGKTLSLQQAKDKEKEAK